MWIILFPCAAGSFFLIAEGLFTIDCMIPDEDDEKIFYIAASEDIPEVTILEAGHLVSNSMSKWILGSREEHCLKPLQSPLLIGRKTTVAIEEGDPIQWVQTDILDSAAIRPQQESEPDSLLRREQVR